VETPGEGVIEPPRIAPGLNVNLEVGTPEKRPVMDLDLNAPAEDGSPRGEGAAPRSDVEASPPERNEEGVGSEGAAEKGSGGRKRKGVKDEEEEGEENTAGMGGWPASVPLTLRLKRLISHLARGLKKPVGVTLQRVSHSQSESLQTSHDGGGKHLASPTPTSLIPRYGIQ
jgi:hypothetical protein